MTQAANMSAMQRRFALATLAGACLLPAAARAATLLPTAEAVPGGVAIVELGPASAARPAATFGGKPVLVIEAEGAWVAVVGIALSADPNARHTLAVQEPAAARVRCRSRCRASSTPSSG